MARTARIKIDGIDTWYHICARAAGKKGYYPLMNEANQRRLIALIQHFSSAYFCEVSGFSVMGNHYHLVLKMEKKHDKTRAELMARAKILYPNSEVELSTWDDDRWEHLRLRLFNLSRIMSNLQQAFTRWYNSLDDSVGSFWSERFKSTILLDNKALIDCLLYVDLNPLRAGLQEIPELHCAGSLCLRHLVKDHWLTPLKDILPNLHQSGGDPYLEYYRAKVYYRGSVATKKNQATLLKAVLTKEIARGFKVPGMYLQRCNYFVGGLALGSEAKLKQLIKSLQKKGHKLRDSMPILHADGNHQSLKKCRAGPLAT